MSIKGMYFMGDMKINKMNKQREVSILMQNTLSILLNINNKRDIGRLPPSFLEDGLISLFYFF